MMTRGNVAKNNKTRFFYVLYSDKTWVFDQSERAQGPIYIINETFLLREPEFLTKSRLFTAVMILLL